MSRVRRGVCVFEVVVGIEQFQCTIYTMICGSNRRTYLAPHLVIDHHDDN